MIDKLTVLSSLFQILKIFFWIFSSKVKKIQKLTNYLPNSIKWLPKCDVFHANVKLLLLNEELEPCCDKWDFQRIAWIDSWELNSYEFNKKRNID